MYYDVQEVINRDINLKKFLRENSYWYKELNRSRDSLPLFINDMKEKYKLTTSDKLNKTLDNINMISSFLDVLK